MGICSSKPPNTHLDIVDDSIHVMISKDKQKQRLSGLPATGYVPRAEHPSMILYEPTLDSAEITVNKPS